MFVAVEFSKAMASCLHHLARGFRGHTLAILEDKGSIHFFELQAPKEKLFFAVSISCIT